MKSEKQAEAGWEPSPLDAENGPHPNRKLSQARTRARLIEVGREHFLRLGLAGATAQRIADEAGFTRGAVYANFASMEELFAEVMRASSDRDMLMYQTIYASDASAVERFAMLREAIARMITDSRWIVLQAEFQANALRSPTMRAAYVEQQATRRAHGEELLRGFARELPLEMSGPPEAVVATLGSLIEGLAIRQAILRESDGSAERELVLACFDRLVRRAG